MSDRDRAWRRRADAATGSRPVGPRGGPGGGLLDDIDALLAADDPAEGAGPDSPKGEDDREPLL
ncbi:hypothetical protein LWC35_32985 [Pseudonocardia kujensis]|uniref:hypothetical protein n=1 Tax=Pseudonocardia kujensis TaxID=1128675 RepID=UPI001E51A5F2|nr:hypothetical protein [Pseudonocardia kujensis]MCE0767676.1 hypothetical protein [Pseudonocardia kujensis]